MRLSRDGSHFAIRTRLQIKVKLDFGDGIDHYLCPGSSSGRTPEKYRTKKPVPKKNWNRIVGYREFGTRVRIAHKIRWIRFGEKNFQNWPSNYLAGHRFFSFYFAKLCSADVFISIQQPGYFLFARCFSDAKIFSSTVNWSRRKRTTLQVVWETLLYF